MKIKELINKLSQYDEEQNVIIRFAVSEEDDIGYILGPVVIDKYVDEVAIYCNYNDTEEDCNFIGQKNLTKLWEEN